jgi:cardiolipin synthase
MASWWNPANLLTVLRLALVPCIAVAILNGRHLAALILFFLAGVTDGIDGPLARRFHWSSRAGAYLDPIADKVLLSTVYICLAAIDALPWWFVVVVCGRDILILLAAGLALAFDRVGKFPPSVWGKLSTFLQIVTAVVWMSRKAFPPLTLDSIATVLLWLTTAATAWSGIHYTGRGAQMLRNR